MQLPFCAQNVVCINTKPEVLFCVTLVLLIDFRKLFKNMVKIEGLYYLEYYESIDISMISSNVEVCCFKENY